MVVGMKFIIILTLIFSLSYTATSSANTCSQTFTPKKTIANLEVENATLKREVESYKLEEWRRKDNWEFASVVIVSALCLPLAFILFPWYWFTRRPPKNESEVTSTEEKMDPLDRKLTISPIIKKEDFEAAKTHIQKLEKSLGLPQKKAIRLALGSSSNPFRFKNNTQSQELFAEIDHLTSYWGLSKPIALQSIKAHKYIKKNTTEVLQKVSEILEETGQLSREEAKKIIQSFETINQYLIENLLYAISTLSQAGFTNKQIIQIIELNIVRKHERRSVFNFFQREQVSINEKKERLRQAGFTEAEINRIPIEIMQKTKGEIAESTFLWSFAIGTYTQILDGLQWLFTGSSFIW